MPKYLEVALNISLFSANTAQKYKPRHNIIQKLAGTTWGAKSSVHRISALGLVYPIAEYWALVSRSINTGERKLGVVLVIFKLSKSHTFSPDYSEFVQHLYEFPYFPLKFREDPPYDTTIRSTFLVGIWDPKLPNMNIEQGSEWRFLIYSAHAKLRKLKVIVGFYTL